MPVSVSYASRASAVRPTGAQCYGARSNRGRLSRRVHPGPTVGEGVRVRVGDLVAVGRRVGVSDGVGVIVIVALGVNVAVGVVVQALGGEKSGGGTPRRLLTSEPSRTRCWGSMRSAVRPDGAKRGSPQALTAGSMSQLSPGGSDTTWYATPAAGPRVRRQGRTCRRPVRHSRVQVTSAK